MLLFFFPFYLFFIFSHISFTFSYSFTSDITHFHSYPLLLSKSFSLPLSDFFISLLKHPSGFVPNHHPSQQSSSNKSFSSSPKFQFLILKSDLLRSSSYSRNTRALKTQRLFGWIYKTKPKIYSHSSSITSEWDTRLSLFSHQKYAISAAVCISYLSTQPICPSTGHQSLVIEHRLIQRILCIGQLNPAGSNVSFFLSTVHPGLFLMCL